MGKKIAAWAALALIGCNPSGPASPPTGGRPESTRPGAARTEGSSALGAETVREPAKHATAVRGTRYDLQKILVPGAVTVVEFMAPW